MPGDIAAQLREQIKVAAATRTPLAIVGGGTKQFYGRAPAVPAELRVADHSGIVSYEPNELVITARAGTKLAVIEAALAESNQMMPFEPPHFGLGATIGGTIACNLSGPRRAYAGAARDYLLGVEILNGRGERLRFGGQVMKNVAGYDVSRLMAGALGTLGVLLEVTLKVLPLPATALTLRHEFTTEDALQAMNRWAGKPYPITATCFDGNVLLTRIEGAASAVNAARAKLGGEIDPRHDIWSHVREHSHGFFRDPRSLWRVSVPQSAAAMDLPGKWLFEWGGGLRWLYSDEPATRIRAAAQNAGGHATLFRAEMRDGEIFHPLSPALLRAHRNLKSAFDPEGILNPGRMYAEI